MNSLISNLIIIAVITAIVVLLICYRKRLQRLIDYALSKSVFHQLMLLVVVTGVIFGFLLLVKCFIPSSQCMNIPNHIYSFINPGSTFPEEITDSSDKVWAIIIGACGMILLSGFLISIFSNILERRVDKIKNGQVYYYFKNHVVIIGYDQMSIGLIYQLAEDNRYRDSEIVLQTIQGVPKVQHELFPNPKSEIKKKVTIISGNRTSGEDLERLHINRCKEVFILGENDEYDNDSLNVECVKKIYNILSKSKKIQSKMIRCNVLFDYQSTFAIFQRQDIDRFKDRIDFVPFNYYETWVQKVFVDRKYEVLEKDKTLGMSGIAIDFTPLDRQGITADSDKKVQLVVIGMSNMGVAMGIQATHLCHFPNFITKGIKTRITFIDENADKEMNFMRGRYRHLFEETDIYYKEVDRKDMATGNIANEEMTKIPATKEIFTDIEFEFIRARVEYPVIQKYLADLSCDKDIYLTIAICFCYPPKAVAAGLYLPDEVYDNHIPVLVQQEISYCTMALLTENRKYRYVKPFGMLDNCYDLGKADDRIPMMVNYVYSKGTPEKFSEEELLTMWHNLPTAHKWSNRYNADSISFKTRSFKIDPGVPLDDDQIRLMAKVEHNRWNIEKLLMGYRATTPQEKEEISRDLSLKNKFKKDRFAHNDICDYTDLQDDAAGTNASEYDRRISASLPLIIKTDQRLQNIIHQTIEE